jgi:hypothetical protein
MDSHRNSPQITEDVTFRTASDCQQRLSVMVADGEVPIPIDWEPDRLLPLLDLVHRTRRHSLVKFIARVIANDIRRQERREEKNHVEV